MFVRECLATEGDALLCAVEPFVDVLAACMPLGYACMVLLIGNHIHCCMEHDKVCCIVAMYSVM